MIINSLRYVYRESGLASVFATGTDAWIIIVARSCRMFAYGASALVLALFFAELDVSDERIGLFMTLTLAGDVGLSLLLTLVADHVGRRRTLMFGSVLMIMSGTTFALSENYWLLLIAAVAGVISATGGDFGPFRAVEESMLSEVTNPNTRADVLVWYVTTSALGSAVGTEVAGRVVHYLNKDSVDGGLGWTLRQAYHACYLAYAAMGLLNLALALLLSQKSELQRRASDTIAGQDATDSIPLASRPNSSSGSNTTNKNHSLPQTPTTSGHASNSGSMSSSGSSTNVGSDEGSILAGRKANDDDDDSDFDDDDDDEEHALTRLSSSTTSSSPPTTTNSPSKTPGRFSQISKKTRSIMYGLWFLLMVDSLADGMASIALTSYYMDTKFHMGKDSLGNILSISYLLAAFSSVFAGPLSRYIGLINTMVFTHVPSSAAVLLFPLPSSIGLTYALLLLRIGLNNLDQAPRSALIAAVVRPEERTAVLGITSLLRTLASTTGPTVTGFLAGSGRFWIAFVVAGALRLAYDFGLFAMFVNIRLYQYEPTEPFEARGTTGTAGAYAANDTNGDYSSVPGHPDTFVLDEEESIEGDLVAAANAHGLVTSPAARTPGNATAAVCGQTMVSFYQQDNTSYPEALLRTHPKLGSDYNPDKCNLYLCRGYQFGDNTQHVQSYKAGQIVDMSVFIRIPHKGYANVSVVDTTTNSAIGAPLISWPDNYAATLNPPANQTKFSVTIPALGNRCTTAGTCVLQWYWLGQGQTYESCVDFTTPAAASGRLFNA
ncbi:hypothetical protein SCUCBS95973_000978 [Sporothrix curviconia]|uniref:Major facilitator superfamily (MFS) profile domain-containing protein n=1 Tax=Sporothrix curviconia TaxID=1260050 RepID=A0ABP0AV31_9PEZI